MHRFVSVGVFMRGISTYSRGGFLGAAALGIIGLVRSERKIRTLLGICVLAGLVLGTMPQQFWDRMDTIYVENEEDRDDSAAGRIHFWRVGAQMAAAKPLTGVGLLSYNYSYEAYNTDERFVGVRAAHSIWFGVMGDLGYVGFVLFVANLAAAFWAAWRVVRLAGRDPRYRDLRIYGNAIISSLVVYAITGSFLSMQYSEMAWHLFGLAAALHWVTKAELASATAVPARAAA